VEGVDMNVENRITKFGAKTALVVALLALAITPVFACPVSVNCAIDGMAMFQTNCEFNVQTHKQVCRFEHQHFEDGQNVTHYRYVQCD
jgi:hypothetical protein